LTAKELKSVTIIITKPMLPIAEVVKELEYFYEMLEEKKPIKSKFAYNLNAFISRGRTITWIIKKQYSHRPGFATWYSKIEKEMKADELMQFFVNARNISLKEQPIVPSYNLTIRHVKVTSGKTLRIPVEGVPFWVERNEKGQETKEPTHEFDNGIHMKYYFEVPKPPKTFRNLQAIDLCKIYLENLKEIAAQATTLFRER
jgi:hypothetical protein